MADPGPTALEPTGRRTAVEEGPRARVSCFACGSGDVTVFYEVRDVPVHSCVLLTTQEAALRFPRGDVRLGFCRSCGFIENVAFDRTALDYSRDYEETQGFSPRFNAFARSLAERLIDRYGLRGKHVLEIGCGKGEFLALLCELGGNRGTGIDPGYVPGRLESPALDRMTFIREYYSERHSALPADLVCCRHTLEHIQPVAEFVGLVRRAAEGGGTVVFFEVPDVVRVLRELAFWDIYHEHCSYFSAGSLGRLFRSSGFDVLDLATDFDDQYLLIEARPARGAPGGPHPMEEPLDELAEAVERFRRGHRAHVAGWREGIERIRARGQRAVVWGSGSKAVAFLTTLGVGEEVEAVEAVVDINPFRQGMYMPGTGHPIVGPRDLVDRRPDVVIVMNPIYLEEIRLDLGRLDVEADLVAV